MLLCAVATRLHHFLLSFNKRMKAFNIHCRLPGYRSSQRRQSQKRAMHTLHRTINDASTAPKWLQNDLAVSSAMPSKLRTAGKVPIGASILSSKMVHCERFPLGLPKASSQGDTSRVVVMRNIAVIRSVGLGWYDKWHCAQYDEPPSLTNQLRTRTSTLSANRTQKQLSSTRGQFPTEQPELWVPLKHLHVATHVQHDMA
jgi:hypothetical protein